MTQWTPAWQLTINGVDYTNITLANLTIVSGRADVIASGQISVMMYGYGAIATKIGAGAFKNNKA